MKSMCNLAARSTFISAGVLSGLLCGGAALGASNGSIPDFSPNDSVSWVGEGGFKPLSNGAGPVTEDPSHPAVGNDEFRRTGKQPSFATADLSNPILQPWARDALRKRNERILAGEPGFGPRVSCWPGGVPTFLLGAPFRPMFIIQGTKEVVMILQLDHQIRRIYLDVPHSANVKPSWYGESIGHYEGDTLVVDTIGLNDRTYVDNFLTPHTDKLHVVERFRLIDGGKTIEVSIHVEDPGAFTTPWNAIQRYRQTQGGPMEEMVCAENNAEYFGYEVVPLLQAKTPDF
jgi:hypothetical protein